MEFSEPLLPMADESRFRAFVIPPLTSVKVAGVAFGGRSAYVYRGRDPRANALIISGVSPEDAAHELFHAVQYNSPAWDDTSETPAAWIEEGTAEAVGLAFDGQNPEPDRPFDELLNWQPPTKNAAYEDQYFWRRVGQAIGAQDDVQYLVDILDTNLKSERGIREVDACPRKYGGLYDLLPEFFSAFDIDREFPSPVTGKTSYYFGKPDEHEIELLPVMDRESRTFSKPKLKATAGDASKVRVKHYSDKPVEVEISVVEEADPLHLIVDEKRYDSHSPDGRNVFRTILNKGTQNAEYDVIVANIAKNTAQGALCSKDSSTGGTSNGAESNRDLSYRLKVRLREINCMVSVTVDNSARGGSPLMPFTINMTPDGSAITGLYGAPAPGSVYAFAFGEGPFKATPLPVGKTGPVPVIIDGNTPGKGRFNSHRKSNGDSTGLAQPMAQIN